MYRDIPVFNRPIIDKINRTNLQKHLQRLKNIKTTFAQKNVVHTRSISNRKAELQQQHRKTEAEKQNVILFNKMMKIMKRSDPNNTGYNYHINLKPRSSINFQKIQQENISLFQRLDQQKPTINNKKLSEDRAKNLNLLRFLGKYPNPTAQKFYQKRKYIESESKNRVSDYDLEEEITEGEIYQYQNQFKEVSRQRQLKEKRRRFTSQNYNRSKSKRTEEAEQISNTSNIHQTNKNINPHQNHIIKLYSANQHLFGQEAHIQIIRDYNGYEFILSLLKSNNEYRLKITEVQGNSFFVKYDYNYKNIIKLLTLQNGILKISEIKTKNPENVNQVQNKNSKNLHFKYNQQQQFSVKVGQTWGNYQEALQESVE